MSGYKLFNNDEEVNEPECSFINGVVNGIAAGIVAGIIFYSAIKLVDFGLGFII